MFLSEELRRITTEFFQATGAWKVIPLLGLTLQDSIDSFDSLCNLQLRETRNTDSTQYQGWQRSHSGTHTVNPWSASRV